MKKKIKLGDIIDTLDTPSIEDWILLALYLSPNKRMKSELYLQKALFIASHHLERLKEVLEFKPYRLGPYSEILKEKLEILENNNSIIIDKKRGLLLTEKGEKRAEDRKTMFLEEEMKYLNSISDFVNALSEDELLLFTYVIYKAYEKSDVFNTLLRRRKDIAIKMLRKGVISTSLAAKLAGLTLLEFIKLLKQKDIKPYRADENDLKPV